MAAQAKAAVQPGGPVSSHPSPPPSPGTGTYYLFLIGAVAFTAATIGYRRRRHRPGDTGHIAGIGIGYTAMLTAFYVDNTLRRPLWDRPPVLAFWLFPGAIATPLIARAVIGARHAAPQAQLDAGSGFPGKTVS